MDGRVYLGERVHELDHIQACSPDCDRHPERCGRNLYATWGDEVANCTRCVSEYDVPETQAWMRDQIRDEVHPAKFLAAVLRRLGWTVTVAEIHGLAQAQLLPDAGRGAGHR